MSNVQRMEAISNVKKRKYKCPFCDNRYDRVRMITHIEKKHPEYISDDYTATRIVFNLVNKKEKGTCVMCGKESPWNEEKGRYDRFCSPECVKAYTKLADRRLKDVTGKTKQELLKDPEYQNKVMLSHRSISGEYTFQDGSKKKYVGTYEKNFLRFMDVFLNIKSEDIETPGPIIDYEYKGKKHKWITDAYYAPYNLVFDIKDGGDNPNNREMPKYRAKQDAKEDAIKKLNKYNYIRLTDNKFEQLIQLMMELKELYVDNNSIYDPIIRINESTIIEDNIITEAVIFDKDDAYYNFDKFVNGQCNILFITGFSGGGKTTLTKEYSKKYKAEIIEIDNFECYMNRVKKDDGSVYSEFLYKTDFGKEYMERYMGLTDTSVNLIFQRDFTNEMMKFLLEYCGKRKNQKFIIEGMQVFRWEDYQKIKDYALIIKGTSALTSAIRRIKRNKEEMSISHILELMRWYVKDDKMMNKLHKVYKESSLDNNEDDEMMTEGYLLNRKDIYYNKDKFDSGEINLCFITGHSGSGKTTMGRYMQNKKNVETYGLDDLIANYNFSDDNLKEYGDLIYSYFKGPGRKYRYHSKEELYNDSQWDGTSDYNGFEYTIMKTFIDYAMKYSKSHKNTKFVLEGVWVFEFFNPQYFKDYAVYIKGVSALISNIRASKRDNSDGKNNLDILKNRSKQFTSYIKNYMLSENKLRRFYNYYSKLSKSDIKESSLNDNIDTIVFDIGDVLLRCDSEYIFSNYKMLNNKQKEEALSLLDKDYDEYSLEEILLYIDEHFPDLSNHKDELIDLYSQIDPYDYTYDLLNTLKNRGYKLYYLSNWSKWGIELLKMQNKLGFLDIFDGGLFSYEINMRKPDKNIYEYFIDKFDIIPDKTIFFDDKRKNIEAAKEIGMNAYEFNYEEYDYILNSHKSLRESINNSSTLTEKGSYILLKEYVEPNSLTVYDEYTYSTIDSAIRLEQLYNQNIHCYSYDRNTDTVNYLGEMNVIKENGFITVNWVDEISPRVGYIAEQLIDEDYNSFVNEEAVYDDKHKNPIYVILMSGVSPLSYAIKKFTKGEYTHCCISFNSKLTPFYSFGMKENLSLKDMGFSILNPRVKEYQNNKVKFAVYTMFVSDNQRKKMIQRLKWFKEKEAFLGYDFIGLIKYVLNRSSDGNLEKWFCSRFVMEILGQGIKIGRDASLYSPQQVKDELTNISLVNKGDNFYEYDHRITDKNVNDIKNGRYNYSEE